MYLFLSKAEVDSYLITSVLWPSLSCPWQAVLARSDALGARSVLWLSSVTGAKQFWSSAAAFYQAIGRLLNQKWSSQEIN